MKEQDEQTDIFKDIDEQIRVLVLVTGTLEDGTSQWAYASIPLTRYEAFKKAQGNGHYDLGDYGLILENGGGNKPPAEIIQKMKDEHGTDHKFEDEMDAMMRNFNALIAKRDEN